MVLPNLLLGFQLQLCVIPASISLVIMKSLPPLASPSESHCIRTNSDSEFLRTWSWRDIGFRYRLCRRRYQISASNFPDPKQLHQFCHATLIPLLSQRSGHLKSTAERKNKLFVKKICKCEICLEIRDKISQNNDNCLKFHSRASSWNSTHSLFDLLLFGSSRFPFMDLNFLSG